MNRLYYPVFLASLALAGCGSDSDSSSPQDTEQPEVFNILGQLEALKKGLS